MGSVLMDRGDRISWTGDAYVSQSTFYSFASDYSIALQNLNLTSCDDCCQGIASYCLLFVLSACDYLAQTGDTASFQYFLPVITRKLEEGYRRYYGDFSLHSMRFWGVRFSARAPAAGAIRSPLQLTASPHASCLPIPMQTPP